MKKVIPLLLSLVLALSIFTLPSFGTDAATMIDDFEDGGTTLADGYWSTEFTTEKVSTTAKNGSKSLKAAYTTGNQWNNPAFQTASGTLGISVGDKTHLSVWVKTEATVTTASFGLRVRFVDGAGKTWYNYNTNLNYTDTNAGFVQVNLKLTDFLDYTDATGTVKYDPNAAGAGTINSIVFAPMFTEDLTNKFTMYLDDLSLTKESTAAPVSGPMIDDFEDGGIGYWSANYTEYDVDETVAKNGSKSLKLVKDNASQWPELHTATGGHNIGVGDKTYIAAWVKTDGAGETGSFEFRYQIVDSNGKKWYNYNTKLNIVSTEEDFVMAAAKLSDFMDFDTSTEHYDPTAEGAGIIDKFVIILNGTPTTTFTVWLDDIQLIDEASVVAPPTVDEGGGNEPGEPDEPIEIDPPTIDTTGTLTYLQDFEDIDNVADSAFNFEVETHGTLSLETDPANVHDGEQSLRIDFNGSAGYTSLQALCENLCGGKGVDLTDYTHLEIWMKTSVDVDAMMEDGKMKPFNVRQRFNFDGNWWYYAKDIYPIHTNEDFVQYRIPLSSLIDYSGLLPYDPEMYGAVPWMYQFDLTTPQTPFTIWLDGVALVKVDPSEQTDGFTVSFNSMGGSVVADQIVAANGTATKPADPTRDGYVFDGWTYDAGNGTYEAYDFSTPVTADIELRASWKAAGGNSGTGNEPPETYAGYALLPVMLVLLAVSGAIALRAKKSMK